MSPSPRHRCSLIGSALLATSISITPTAHADDAVVILAGDGGIVQQHCGAQPQQIRVDSSSFSTFSACFGLVKPTGWAAVNITGSYGVVNNLTVPFNVAFKLPDGAVYWQDTVAPGQVKSVDVNNAGSTIVELHVFPVGTSNGASTATLTPGTTATPNYVSLRSASPTTPGRIVRVTWAGATTTALTRNSSFLDRLDGSFLVTKGLSDPACVSLQSAAYPGMYLQATSPTSFSLSLAPKAAGATWCANPATTPVTSTRLVWAADRTKALAVTSQGKLTLGTVDSADSRWFSDHALARP
ncbi:AbfB domain-containing protein [Corynebacterium auriscanis]|uniref:AbfB domain-containing protein n=1 Tax=Corynebacterium auriscanis TaxID=99807 RepID=UPI002246BF73|nr:AbfB domain-containing protein [Corynebacterium auriscanis]MCX2162569.1 AbfB domain-containing protein [Corynebacterium auriscanis]